MDRVQAQRFFQTHNHERIQRLLQLAPARHRLVLELLPFLFHLNAKLLPGYIDEDTPAGLIDYRPGKTTLDSVRQLEKNFRYRQKALRRYPLRGLYLIQPHSLLRYPKHPRFGLWLLHTDLLKENQRVQLQQKVDAVALWARENGIELDTKLLSEADVARGALTAWERDQLYSAGLVLAGSQPYWWLTSPEEDRDYTASVENIRSQRLLSPVSLIDFGAVDRFDADSLFYQARSVVNDSLHDGNQALSLAYLRRCLTAPDDAALSSRLKQQMYQQQTDTGRMDPGYLKLLCLQQQTDWTEWQRLFYLGQPERLSKPIRQATHPWRRQFMENRVNEWGWEADKLKQLDDSIDDILRIDHDYQAVGRLSAEVINLLAAFCHEQQLDAVEALQQLKTGHRLRYMPAVNQVALLPAPLRPDSGNESLFLTRFRDHNQWCLSRQAMLAPGDAKLFEHEHLLQVLAYGVGNRLMSRSNWLSVNDQHGKVSTKLVVELCQQLCRSQLPGLELNFDAINVAEHDRLDSISLFINLEAEAGDKLSQQGLQLSSRLNDPLNYSSYHQSLVTSLEGLLISRLGACYSFQFRGPLAVMAFLEHMLAWQPDTDTSWHSWCPTPVFGQTISLRLDDLMNQVISHYHRYPDSGRFVLSMADRLYSLQWQQQQINLLKQPLSQDLWQTLASRRDEFEAVRLDRYLDRDSLFNSLLQFQSPQRINVFIYLENNTITCYLLDEFANLIKLPYQHLTEATLVAHLQLFLSEIRQRNQVPQLRFYHLNRQHAQWRASPVAVTKQVSTYLPVKVAMSSTANDAHCSIICGPQQFEGTADDPALFDRVRQLVLNLRSRHSQYPVYLNSLQFADGRYYPAAVYMQQKQRLEQLFNPV